MALSKEEILEAISEMSVMDIVDLIEAMEEKFGVSAAAPVAVAGVAAPADGGAAAAEGQAPCGAQRMARHGAGTEGCRGR